MLDLEKNNAVLVPITCRQTKKKFYARYDLAYDKVWVLAYGLTEFPEDMGSRDGVGTTPEQTKIDLSNMRMGPQYKCPYCGARNFVKCGRCGEFTCYEPQGGRFECACCGHSGEVSGTLSELGGSGMSSQR